MTDQEWRAAMDGGRDFAGEYLHGLAHAAKRRGKPLEDLLDFGYLQASAHDMASDPDEADAVYEGVVELLKERGLYPARRGHR